MAAGDGCANVCDSSGRALVCEDIQADVEDGHLQFFYLLAFVLQGDVPARPGRFNASELLPSLLQLPARFLSGFGCF